MALYKFCIIIIIISCDKNTGTTRKLTPKQWNKASKNCHQKQQQQRATNPSPRATFLFRLVSL